jgi:hypothetical protein
VKEQTAPGFTFDGRTVTIRDKTISKYYNKLNRKLKRFSEYRAFSCEFKDQENKSRVELKKIVTGIKIYRRYGFNKGASKPKNRNFLTYVNNAAHIFGPTERINLVRERHIQKIRKTSRIKITLYINCRPMRAGFVLPANYFLYRKN